MIEQYTDEDRQDAEETWVTSNRLDVLLRWSLTLLELDRKISFKRKLRLFAVACLRRVSFLFRDTRTRGWIDMIEQNADGLISDEEQDRLESTLADPPNEDLNCGDEQDMSQVGCARTALFFASDHKLIPIETNNVAGWARDAANSLPRPIATWDERRILHDEMETAVQVALLRDIFGNPFHPVRVDPSWRTPTVTALAQTIYTDRAFDTMPILADALEEAGCTSDDILTHCRGGGDHVRGCWVVDLLLAKE
jgi:hypothetical protein